MTNLFVIFKNGAFIVYLQFSKFIALFLLLAYDLCIILLGEEGGRMGQTYCVFELCSALSQYCNIGLSCVYSYFYQNRRLILQSLLGT